jgi:hypothetical protein
MIRTMEQAYDAYNQMLDESGPVVIGDESMDGDFDSGMASAGFGTDEDYGYSGD